MPKAKLNPKYNVTIQHLGSDGKAKKIWQENWLMNFLLKHKVITPAMQKIPFLFGSWQMEKIHSNLITNVGLAGMSSRLNGAGGAAAFTFVAIGIGVTAPAVTDTALASEIVSGGGSRTAATATQTTTTVTNDTSQDVAIFTFTSSFAVTESGVFNAASGPTLLARQTFAAVNVVSTDAIQVTWKISFA